MLAWMLYVMIVTALLTASALVAERAARLRRRSTRWIWLVAIAASLLIPTVISSVSVQIPNILKANVTQPVVVLRQQTNAMLSPVMWLSGNVTPPPAWRSMDSDLKRIWLGMSGALLLALVCSGAYLLWRSRSWQRGVVANTAVFLTDDVGPAVVGLLRPRIALPNWVAQTTDAQQAEIIAHERAHLDAGDPRLFTFALSLLVFMPWNLTLWWQLRRLKYAIEVDCDARVLRGGFDAAHYGETLIAVGEKKSTYIGAVAAMSESSSFLEQRIRIMITKPSRWNRIAAYSCVAAALAFTGLAAQVSPPNAGQPGSATTATASGERTAIKLPIDTLDRYVGVYRLTDNVYMEVRRIGNSLMARLTGQQEFEIFPESNTDFFFKVVNAQIHFDSDGTGPAMSATLHQNGRDISLQRSDSALAAQAQINLDARIQSQTPQPGSEVALRKMIASISAGTPNYQDLEPALADAVRQQLPRQTEMAKQLGEMRSVTFRGVGDQGWDVYDVQYEHGHKQWRIQMAQNGKVAGALMLALP